MSPGKNVRIRLTSEYNVWCTIFLTFILGKFVAATLLTHYGDIESSSSPPLYHHYSVNQRTL